MRGDRNDRNGPYLASSLLRLGIDPARITVVGDEPADLRAALAEGLSDDLLCISGGLGPTHDDRTVELLAAAAGVGVHVEAELRDGSRSSRAGSRSGSGGRTRTSRTASPSRRRCRTAPSGSASSGRRRPWCSTQAPAWPWRCRGRRGSCRRSGRGCSRPSRSAALLERAQPPARSVLRFYGVSESAVAQSLAAAGGDGDGVDVTICARDFELHVDLFAHPGAEQRAPRGRRRSSSPPAVSLLAGGGRNRGARARPAPRARAPARDRRVVHRRARRGPADGRSRFERRLPRRDRGVRQRGQAGAARRPGAAAARTARSRPRSPPRWRAAHASGWTPTSPSR